MQGFEKNSIFETDVLMSCANLHIIGVIGDSLYRLFTSYQQLSVLRAKFRPKKENI